MLLTLDGNSEIGAHSRSDLCHLIYSGHLISYRAVTYQIFISEKTYFHAVFDTGKILGRAVSFQNFPASSWRRIVKIIISLGLGAAAAVARHEIFSPGELVSKC